MTTGWNAACQQFSVKDIRAYNSNGCYTLRIVLLGGGSESLVNHPREYVNRAIFTHTAGVGAIGIVILILAEVWEHIHFTSLQECILPFVCLFFRACAWHGTSSRVLLGKRDVFGMDSLLFFHGVVVFFSFAGHEGMRGIK